MRLYISDSGTVHLAADTGAHIDSVSGRLYEEKVLEVFFTRDGEIIRNATASPDLLLARDVGTNKFDTGRINVAPAFTEQNDGTNYWWKATLDFTQPVYEKLLGVDLAAQREEVSFTCVADVGGSLHHAYLKIEQATGAFRYAIFYTSGTGEEASAAAPSGSAGGSVISIAADASAEAVATALAAATSLGDYTITRVDDVVTFTATTVGARGWHSAGSTGFVMTLVACGMSPLAVSDEPTATLLAQFTYNVSDSPQSTQLFDWVVENSLRRPTVIPPGLAPGRMRKGAVFIDSDAAYAVVTFPAVPTADWFPTCLAIVNTTDVAPPNLTVMTMTAKSATGFTVRLNADAPTGNYKLLWAITW